MDTTNNTGNADNNLIATATENQNMTTENNPQAASTTPTPTGTFFGRHTLKASKNATLAAGEYDVYEVKTATGTALRTYGPDGVAHTVRRNQDGSFSICAAWSKPAPGAERASKSSVDLSGLRSALTEYESLGGDASAEVATFTAALTEKLTAQRAVAAQVGAAQKVAQERIAALLSRGVSPEQIVAALAGVTAE